MFYNETDMHMLRDGTHSVGRFDTIGTVEEDETSAYILKNYMSYDEMALSSMLAISSHTFFINNGDRWNLAKPGDRGSFVPYGVYIGMVGIRVVTCVSKVPSSNRASTAWSVQSTGWS